MLTCVLKLRQWTLLDLSKSRQRVVLLQRQSCAPQRSSHVLEVDHSHVDDFQTVLKSSVIEQKQE